MQRWIEECTVVDLSTRTAFLNIDQSLQFWTFWSQSKALFMIRCMFSAGSGSKMLGALKVIICVKCFELSVQLNKCETGPYFLQNFQCMTMFISVFCKSCEPMLCEPEIVQKLCS